MKTTKDKGHEECYVFPCVICTEVQDALLKSDAAAGIWRVMDGYNQYTRDLMSYHLVCGRKKLLTLPATEPNRLFLDQVVKDHRTVLEKKTTAEIRDELEAAADKNKSEMCGE